MKIVNVEDFFIPDAGYQINILSKYLAKFGHEVYIVTSKLEELKGTRANFFGIDGIEQRDKEYTKNTGVKVIRISPKIKRTISKRVVHFKEFFETVENLKPDIVYVHGNDTLTGMRYIMKKKRNYALITDSHMLPMASVNKFKKLFYWFYRKVVTPQIIKDKLIVIRTQNDSFVEESLGIPLRQAPWISYGTDTQYFHPDENVKYKLRKENNIDKEDFVVVYTGKLDEAKGGKLLAETFKRKFEINRKIILIVVGSTTDEYGAEVDKIFSESENRIIRFPTQKYYELAKFYQMADLSVFAKQCSLSFYDAQACGIPVLSENNNINLERCSHNNGWNFSSDNVESFRKKIIEVASLKEDAYKVISYNAYNFIKENYNYEDKAREYENWIKVQYNKFLSCDKVKERKC